MICLKNAIAIKIINIVEHNAEAEYLLEFLRFIGCFAYNESFDSWNEAIKNLRIDSNYQVEIYLNYYGKSLRNTFEEFYANESFYMYFDVEKQVCEVKRQPLNRQSAKQYPSKKATRQKALELITNTIWHDDLINQKCIEDIQKLYIDDDTDFFYTLQELQTLEILQSPFVLKEYITLTNRKDENIKCIPIAMTPNTRKLLTKLWKMQCLLKDINPYTTFARINLQINIMSMFYMLYKSEQCKLRSITYNEQTLSLTSIHDLNQELITLSEEYPWLISIPILQEKLYVLHQNYNKYGSYKKTFYFYSSLLNSDFIKLFPNYHSDILYKVGSILWENEQIEKALEYYRNADRVYNKNDKVIYMLARYQESETRYSEAHLLLTRIISCDLKFASIKKILACYEASILNATICLHTYKEYAMRSFANRALQAAGCMDFATLARKLSDNNEQNFLEFESSYKTSDSAYFMYVTLKPWFEHIVSDPFSKKLINNRLADWEA